ncbi:MAG TPA: AzlC family ABC transporter permease [Hydrogenispora sp.]|nr:AzlC family ABC transporter permease [Hydrogenispora sp.]
MPNSSLTYQNSTAAENRPSHEFSLGLRHGLPIALGYLPVSFAFGLLAVKGGLPAWVATLISLTNLTSAGQFAGTNLILAGASLLEITLTTLIINLRYLLMSLSLGQKLSPGMTLRQRCLIAFGITDETFTVASLERTAISFPYMVGLIVGPYTGWGTGTLLGGIVCTLLPDNLQNALGITLYAMFIALVLPPAKKSPAVRWVAAVAVGLSSALTWLPGLRLLSAGWRIMIATLIACLYGAYFFPRKEVE